MQKPRNDPRASFQDIKDIELHDCKNLKIISQLPSNLESITLLRCNNLKVLPKLPQKLRNLVATDCESMEKVPNLLNCTELEVLNLSGCRKLKEIRGWENLHLSRITLIGVPHINFSESIKKVHLFFPLFNLHHLLYINVHLFVHEFLLLPCMFFFLSLYRF